MSACFPQPMLMDFSLSMHLKATGAKSGSEPGTHLPMRGGLTKSAPQPDQWEGAPKFRTALLELCIYIAKLPLLYQTCNTQHAWPCFEWV